MQKQFLVGYIIAVFFVFLSIIKANYEFIAYAAATIVILGIIHYFNKKFSFNKWALWGFDIWMVLHILGGFSTFKDKVLYNFIIIPLVGEPYFILKYDQAVHIYCYFIIAILMWNVVTNITDKKSYGIAAFITVMAATGIGGINEIIEFATTLFFETNVGGYENTALDIISNLAGALLAIPFFKRL
ncbi:DUF2238 domain-containing protein [Nanoarchaeota archaeon]